MAGISPSIASRSQEAVRVLSRLCKVRAAYVFGSHVDGNPGPWSDIDIAAFVEGVEKWDIRQRAQAMVLVQKGVGMDVETHLFPASAAQDPPAGSFAAYVLQHGAPLEIEDITGDQG